jgi:hypothetical protein
MARCHSQGSVPLSVLGANALQRVARLQTGLLSDRRDVTHEVVVVRHPRREARHRGLVEGQLKLVLGEQREDLRMLFVQLLDPLSAGGDRHELYGEANGHNNPLHEL